MAGSTCLVTHDLEHGVLVLTDQQ